MSENRKIAVNSLALSLRMALNVVIMLYVSRVVLRELGVVDFGIYNVVAGLVVLFSFLNEAMSTASQRFISFAIGKSDNLLTLSTLNVTVWVHLAIAILLVLFCETVGYYYFNKSIVIPMDRYDVAKVVFHFSVGTLFFNILLVPIIAWLNAHENIVLVAIFGFIETISKLTLALLLINTSFDKLLFYSVGLFVVTCLIFVLQLTYSYFKYSNFRVSRSIDIELFKEVASFASWSLLGNISFLGRSQGNALLLNLFFGTILNAAYAISNQVVTQVINFSFVLTKAFMPQIVKSYANGDLDRMHNLLFNAVRYSFIVMIILVVPLLGELDSILSLWLGDYPAITTDMCRLMLVQSILMAIMQPMETSVQATGKIILNQIGLTLMTAIFMFLSYLCLLQGYGPLVVIVANIVTYISFFIFRVLYLEAVIKISLFRFLNEVIVRLLLISALSFVVLQLSEFVSTYSFVRMLFVGAVISISATLIGLKRSEKSFVLQYVLRRF
ncbi:MAG: hypothetical protein ACRC6R_09065 [Bacteroidales bacterium]